MEKKPKPQPQFKRLLNVSAEDVTNALSLLVAEGYTEWSITPQRERWIEYQRQQKVGGPSGTVVDVNIVETDTVAYTVMGWWGREEDDEDQEG